MEMAPPPPPPDFKASRESDALLIGKKSPTRRPWVRPHFIRVEQSPAFHTAHGSPDATKSYSRPNF